MNQTSTIVFFLLSGSFAVIGNTLLKSGMNSLGGFEVNLSTLVPTLIKFAGDWKILIGFSLYGVSSFLYLKLISGIEVTRIYPMLVAYMFIVLLILGPIFLKESLTLTKLAGILVIIFGIFLASR